MTAEWGIFVKDANLANIDVKIDEYYGDNAHRDCNYAIGFDVALSNSLDGIT